MVIGTRPIRKNFPTPIPKGTVQRLAPFCVQNPPFGDRKWRLYRYTNDPLELDDLTKSEPKLFAKMQAAYEDYAKEVNLIEVPDDYNPLTQLQKNIKRNQGKEQTKKVPMLD